MRFLTMTCILFAITVTGDVTGQNLKNFTTIQDAINRAEENGLIKVPAGIYRERIELGKKSLKLVAWDFKRDRPGHPFTHIIAPPEIVDPSNKKSLVTISNTGGLNTAGTQVVLEGFSILKGTASRGGGISVTGNVLAEIYRCYISQCHAEDENSEAVGGGIFIGPAASCTVLSSMIINNSAEGEGSGIFVAPFDPEVPDKHISIVNITLTGNKTNRGSALFIGNTSAADIAPLCLYNNIIWNNKSNVDVASLEPVFIYHSISGEAANVICGDNSCIDIDPDFVDSQRGIYRLSRNSILINKGSAAPPGLVRPFNRETDHFADIDGDFLPPDTNGWVGGDLPMGAQDPQEAFIRGDVKWDFSWAPNYDIGIEDAICILSYYFEHEPECTEHIEACEDAADANDDGEIDLADAIYILSFLAETGPQPPAPYEEPAEDQTEDSLSCTSWGPYYMVPGTLNSTPKD